jgi:tetratricopeptide (TPR) repeat protein
MRPARADDAVRYLSVAVALRPDSPGAHLNLGTALKRKGLVDEAVAQYSKAIALKPDYAEAWYSRGVGYEALNQLDKAAADYSKAIEHKPDHPLFWDGRARVYWGLKQFDQALADCSKFIEFVPGLPRAWYNRGRVHVGLEQFDQALADFSKAIELQPDSVEAWNGLAWFLATCPDLKVRDAERAVNLAQKTVVDAPKDGNLWNTLGVAQYRAGAFQAAIKALNKSMELRQGGDSFDSLFLAMAHWQLGKKDEARQWYDKAVEWMEKNNLADDELRRFRTEAEELLGIKKLEPQSSEDGAEKPPG